MVRPEVRSRHGDALVIVRNFTREKLREDELC